MTAAKNADIIIDLAVELREDKWLASFMDNAPVLQAAGKIIENRFPRLFGNRCVTYGLNS